MKKHPILRVLLSAISVLFIMISCGPCKTKKGDLAFTQNSPFSIDNTYCQKWVAGVQGGGSGLNLYATINNVSEGVEMKEFYFRGQITEVKPSKNDLFVGYYTTNGNDVIMNGDTTKEAVNTPPKLFPFDIENNEAVVSYVFNNKTYYHKISNILEKEILAYPSSNPNKL